MVHGTELYNGETEDGKHKDGRKTKLKHSQECSIEKKAFATNPVNVLNASDENICDKNSTYGL